MPKVNPIPPNLNSKDIEQFHRKVLRRSVDECWPYQGRCDNRVSGYGIFTISKTRLNGPRRRKLFAHRIAYFIATGLWPLVDVCHTCDNPPCCNPFHLFAGTRSDNMQDASRKGRIGGSVLGQGTQRPNSKLNEDAVRYIRLAWRGREDKDMTRKELAAKFGVSMGAIQQVTDGRRWRHVK